MSEYSAHITAVLVWRRQTIDAAVLHTQMEFVSNAVLASRVVSYAVGAFSFVMPLRFHLPLELIKSATFLLRTSSVCQSCSSDMEVLLLRRCAVPLPLPLTAHLSFLRRCKHLFKFESLQRLSNYYL